MTLSIIIPVYNSEQYLDKCLISLLNQNWKDYEIILVDDGSVDGSRQKAESLLAGQCNHTILVQENSGVSAARNSGIKHAQGEWITFVDSDDYLSPDYLEILIKNSIGCDLLISGIVFMKGEEEIRRTLPPDKEAEIIELKEEKTMILDYAVSPCGKLYRKAVIDKYNVLFDESLVTAEDRDFNIEFLFRAERIRLIQYAGYHYQTIHEGSLSKDPSFTHERLHASFLYWNKMQKFLDGANETYLAHRLFYFIVDNVSSMLQHQKYIETFFALKRIRPLVDRPFIRSNLKNIQAPVWQKLLVQLYLL